MESSESAVIVPAWKKGLRIGILLVFVLLFFYIGLNVRFMVIPDDYVVLHPHVLPQQHWVFLKSLSSLERGDIVLFRAEPQNGKGVTHISLLAGRPGEVVEFDPEHGALLINGAAIEVDLDLRDGWAEAAYSKTVLQQNEFLLVDNNALAGEQRFWKIERSRLLGEFWWLLPF